MPAPLGNKNAIGNEGGRPTHYSSEILEKSKEYLELAVDKVVKILESTKSKTGKKRYLYKVEVKLPTIEGLCLHLKIRRSTAYEWAEQYVEFADILENLRQKQAERLINKSITGEYNSLITKLLLTKHGYKDQLGLGGEESGQGIKIDVDIVGNIDKIYGDRSGK